MTDLVTEPDIYCPSVNDYGNYIDRIPSFHIMKKGVLCPCGARKDKVYETHTAFSAHTKTKIHQNWLEGLNMNKANYYVENETLKNTIYNQRLMIAKLERDLNNRVMTIDYLTQQLNKNINVNNTDSVNLLDFD